MPEGLTMFAAEQRSHFGTLQACKIISWNSQHGKVCIDCNLEACRGGWNGILYIPSNFGKRRGFSPSIHFEITIMLISNTSLNAYIFIIYYYILFPLLLQEAQGDVLLLPLYLNLPPGLQGRLG